MSTDLAFTLLELVALALPAVGIYMQILAQIQRIGERSELGVPIEESLSFSLARQSLRPLVLAGVILVGYLIALQPPSLFPGQMAVIGSTLTVSLYVSLGLLGYSLLLLGASAGMKTDSHIRARRGGIQVLFRYLKYRFRSSQRQMKNLREWAADQRGEDTPRKIRRDLDSFTWPVDPGRSEVPVDREEQAERIIERGWAKDYQYDSESGKYLLWVSEFGLFLREQYAEGFPFDDTEMEEPVFGDPEAFISEVEDKFNEREGSE